MAYTYANINRVFVGVQTILNKQQLGFASPSQFNTLARIAQDNIFDAKIDELNGQVRNKLRNLETAKGSLQSRVEDDLAPLFVYNEAQTATSGTNIFDYPSNCAHIQGMTYKGYNVDRISPTKASYYVNSYYTPPTGKYSVALMGSNKIEIVGETMSDDLYVSYYRRPRGSQNGLQSSSFPTWAYIVVGENQVYNSSASYDFELPTHLEHELTLEIVSLMGVNLRDTEVVQYAESKIAKDQQTETTSR